VSDPQQSADSSGPTLKLLYIEDSQSDYLLTLRALRKSSLANVVADRVDSETQLRAALEIRNWDVVLSDYNLQEFSALKALEIIREVDPELPFIVVSGAVGEEAALEIMRAGVEDFINKSNPKKLLAAINRSLRERNIRSQERESRRMADEAIKVREQMLAIVSHDIRTPLSSIRLNAQLLAALAEKSPNSLAESVTLHSQMIIKASGQLNKLISDLLDHTAIESGSFPLKIDATRVSQLFDDVRDIYLPLCEDKSIHLDIEIDETRTTLPLDRERIFQVISNLMSNALKFTPPNGRIKLTFENNLDKKIGIFTVEDSGPGVSKKVSNRIFEKFWKDEQAQDSGTGLGLFIARGIVEAHRGQIGLSNATSGGAKFWFHLPTDASTPRTVFKRSHLVPCAPRQGEDLKHVYLVEDDADLRTILEKVLCVQGFRVRCFGMAQEALNALETARIENEIPAVIMVDYRMPEMNGAEFVRHKVLWEKRHSRKIPTILMTAERNINPEDFPEGVQEILKKPPEITELVSTLKRFSQRA
jgi:signal transduction histidine kinase